MLSRRCEYGLAAMLYLAASDHDGYVSIGQISDELNISFPFLTKVLQQLNEAGYLTSMRGPNGGVRLTRSSDRLNLKEIVVALDGAELFTECVLGLPGCGSDKPCPMHDEWGPVRDHLEELFENLSVNEAARRGDEIFRGCSQRVKHTDRGCSATGKSSADPR